MIREQDGLFEAIAEAALDNRKGATLIFLKDREVIDACQSYLAMKGCDKKYILLHESPTDIPNYGLLSKNEFLPGNLETSSCSQPPRSATKMRPMQKSARDCRSRTSAVGRGRGSMGSLTCNTGDAADAHRAMPRQASEKRHQPLLSSASGVRKRKRGDSDRNTMDTTIGTVKCAH